LNLAELSLTLVDLSTMATAKKTAKTTSKVTSKTTTKKTAPKKAAKVVKKPVATRRTSTTRESIQKLRARWPELTVIERSAFAQLVPEAQADALGKQTRAVSVLSQGLRWAVKMDTALRTYPGALASYSAMRFAYYLECLSRLQGELETERGKRAKAQAARTEAMRLREDALMTRKRLVRRLYTFAGAREAEREEVTAALGSSETDEHLAESLRSLAKLAQTYMGRADPESKVLADTAGLSHGDIHAALLSARALASSNSDVQLEGYLRLNDSAVVNRAEGRLLWEMREARRLFNEAHEENPVVPKLEPGAATRHAFVRKQKASSKKRSERAQDEG